MLDGSDLLRVLNQADKGKLAPHLTEVRLRSGAILYEPGDTIDHCFFPRDDAIGCFFVLLENGSAVETLMVGREGAFGGIVSHGAVPAFARMSVLHEGTFYRIATQDLERVKDESPAMRSLFARYSDCVMAQVFQSIACNAVHTIEQRAAKWLIAAVERVGRNQLVMTQEQLASMMGIGRSYASRVLQTFKRDGLLRTRRGGIELIDPPGLRQRACDCHDIVKRHFDTVLAGVYPQTP